MSSIASALLPVFLVIMTGVLLRRVAPLSDEGWRGFGHVTYFVFFPALIIATLASAEFSAASLAGVGTALVTATASTGALMLLLRRPLVARLGGPAFTSLFQGATRWNSFVALAIAGGLHGTQGLSLTAIAFVVLIPALNVAAVSVLTRDGTGDTRPGIGRTLRTLIANPFIWSCGVGLALAPVNEAIPQVLADTLDILGRAALGAGLLMVGAGLEIRTLARFDLAVAIGCVLKLLVLPLIAFGLSHVLGLGGTEAAVVLIAASVPTASASYVLAEKMGGDAPLMARIITAQTLLAFLTMPLFIGLAV